MTKNLQKQLPAPHSPFQCWKIVKFELLSHESVKSTLHRGGEGQNARRISTQNFPTLMAKVVVLNWNYKVRYGLIKLLQSLDITGIHMHIEELFVI